VRIFSTNHLAKFASWCSQQGSHAIRMVAEWKAHFEGVGTGSG
jgi:hypothetical protein